MTTANPAGETRRGPARPTAVAAPPSRAGRLERIVTTEQAVRRFAVPRFARRMTGIVLLLAIWWAGVIPANVFPGPEDIASTLLRLVRSGTLADAIGTSLWRVCFGLAIGSAIGIGLAVTSGLLRLGEDLVDAPMQMFRTMPWVGLTPLLLIWFGIGEAPKVALVAIAVSFPLYLNTYAGIRNVDNNLIEASQTLNLSQLQLVWHVILPGSLPNMLIGLRWALGSAWLALIFGETINATSGLGFLMNQGREFLDLNVIVICLLIYALLGLLADVCVRTLERVLLPWRPAFAGK